jgi:hypothetical protein
MAYDSAVVHKRSVVEETAPRHVSTRKLAGALATAYLMVVPVLVVVAWMAGDAEAPAPERSISETLPQ